MKKNSALKVKASFLKYIEQNLETPMLFLSFVWLVVIVGELVNGITPLLLWAGTGLWLTFILFFVLKLINAPHRATLIKKNWLFIVAIIVPALRLFPISQDYTFARILTATFGMQVVWIFASADFGLRSLGRLLGRRGAGYMLTLTVVVILIGAAGMLSFEKDSSDPQGIHTYPKALWWTSMQITNIGSGYRPITAGGDAICLGISIYAAAMFGYLTAILATFFVGRDAQDPKSAIAGQQSIQKILDEMTLLRQSVDQILNTPPKDQNLNQPGVKTSAYYSSEKKD
jgi:voltage-gated potassium channel